MPFFWGLWDKGFIWDGLQCFIVGVWKEIASGAKQERAERKKVLALAQARKVDAILVTN